MVAVLNEAGIEPDILTREVLFDPATEDDRYFDHVNFKYREIGRSRVPGELRVAAFNALLKKYAPEYDLLININNCLINLPDIDTVSYVFFPRKARIMTPLRDIHRPESILRPYQPYWFYRQLLRAIYTHGSRGFSPSTRHRIICMTRFTRKHLEAQYPVPPGLPIIYPGVQLSEYQGSATERERAIVTMGRFTPGKRQMEQISLAADLPDIAFYIVGFARGNEYYKKCEAHVRALGINNVTLCPDMPFERVKSLLNRTQFFLHTLVNEPFGLTAVQAMAAGCIPIVHDSGGQRETVPDRRLRYAELADVPNIIRDVESLSASDRTALRTQLADHIRQFDETCFRNAFREQMKSTLGATLWSTVSSTK